jgi:assimilatory nitrate reductase catalytic subunit
MHKAVFELPKQESRMEFVLTTGRLKNQWHTMTRAGKSEKLLKNEDEPYCLISAEDAKDSA